MSDDADPLDNPVSISASLTIKGAQLGSFSLSTQSRFFSAADRLLGGVVDLGGRYLDGIAGRRRAKDAVQIELIKAEGKSAIAIAYGDPAFGERVANKLLTDQARKHVNREAVVVSAIEHLQEGADAGADEGEIEDDWLNIFESEAEKASSDRMRDMWGRVLAG